MTNLEVFKTEYVECKHCGSIDLNCEGVCEHYCGEHDYTKRIKGWFYWFCMPGCLPDSESFGPFKTKSEALNNAKQMFSGD